MTQHQFKPRSGPGADMANLTLSRALNEWISKHGAHQIVQTCQACKHMQQVGPAFCTLYNMTPPVAVVVAGCPSFEDNEEVPF